jgi:ribonuclease P/MRP protein subunit RPP1
MLRIVGYTVIAFAQNVFSKVDANTHVNVLDPLLLQLKKRVGVVFLKRLTIILDDESEKGTGLVR